MTEAKRRALELLRVAAAYLKKWDCDDLFYYDGADCDGLCLAEDCEAAAEALEADQ